MPEAKSLLLQLEDENAELRLSEQRLNDEISATKRQLLERDKALAQLTKDLNANAHADRGRDTADTAISAERNRVKELARRNAELETSVKTLEEQLRLQGKALSKAEAAAEEQQRAREETARFAAEAHETLREKDAGARSAARSATKFAQSLVALEAKVAAHDQEMDQRAAEWLQERARLQKELRKAHDENKQLRKADDSQRARAARLQERLDVLTQSLRSHPPSAHCGVGLSGRVAVASASASSLPVRRMTACGSAAGATGGGASSAAAAAVASEDTVPLLLHEQLQREVLSLRASLKKAEAQLRERDQKAVEMNRKLETAERYAASAVAASQRPQPQAVRSTASSTAAASQSAASTAGPAGASTAVVLAPATTTAAATPAAITPTSPQKPSPQRASSCCASPRAAAVQRPSAAMALPVATVRRTSSSPPAASPRMASETSSAVVPAQQSPPAAGAGDLVPRSELSSLVHGVPASPPPPRPNVAAFYALRGKATVSCPVTQTSPDSGEAGGTASSAVVARPPGTITSPDKFRGGTPSATRGIELPVQEPSASAAEFAVAADADEAEIEAALARLTEVERAAEAAEAAELAQAEAAVAAESDAAAQRTADARQLGREIGRELVGEPPPAPDAAPRRLASAREAFRLMDTNGNGRLGRAEVIKAVRRDPAVRALLGLPATIRQEDGSRDRFERVFQAMDRDDSKEVDFEEFSRFFDELQQAREAGEANEAPDPVSPPVAAGAAARANAAATAAAAAPTSAARPPVAKPPAATPPNTQAVAMAQAMLRAASSGGGAAKLNQLAVVRRSPSCSATPAPTSPISPPVSAAAVERASAAAAAAAEAAAAAVGSTAVVACAPLNAGTAITLKPEAAGTSTSTDLALVGRPAKSPQPFCVATPRSGRSTPSEAQPLALHQKASAQPTAFVHSVPDPNSHLLKERQSSFNRCLPPADTQRSAAAIQQDQLRATGAVLMASPRRPENQLKPSSSAKKLPVNWRR